MHVSSVRISGRTRLHVCLCYGQLGGLYWVGLLEGGVLAVQIRHEVYEEVCSLLGRGLLRWLRLVALTSAWIVCELQCSVEEHFLLGGEKEIDFGDLPRYRNS